MSGHVLLSKDEVRSILSLYHLDELEDFGGADEGLVNAAYWVRVNGKRYSLRITERRRVRDMVFERELLECLTQASLPVPRLVENVAKGTFTPWSVRGRFVSLFEHLEGRNLAIFEIRPEHAQQVGLFAARLHASVAGFDRTRENEFDVPGLEKKLHRIKTALVQKKAPLSITEDVEALSRELDHHRGRDTTTTPRGAVHGALSLEHLKWRGGQITGLVDFGFASTERLTWDLAVAINAWCWIPTTEQHGGPSGRFDAERLRAFLSGYQSVRPLSPEELESLAEDTRLAALRTSLTRILEFEMRVTEPTPYRDYRHYLARLRSLVEGGGAEGLIAAART